MTRGQEILGALVLDASLLEACDLTAADFPAGEEQRCFQAIAELWETVHERCIDQALLIRQMGGNGAAGFVEKITFGNYGGLPAGFRHRVALYRKDIISRRTISKIEGMAKTGQFDLDALKPELEAYAALQNSGPQDISSFIRTGTELQQLDIHLEFTVDKLIPSRSIVVLHSRGGLGKTHLALALAKAVSEGQPFLGLETKKRPVLYCDHENPLPLLIERVRHLDVQAARFWHLSADPRPPKLDSPEWTAYARVVEPGSMLIFDTLRSAFDGDENSSQDVAVVMGRLKQLREMGHDIVCLHHALKADDRRYKGSTAWLDLADQSLDFHKVHGSTLEEIDDNDDSRDALFSLGTGEKTRYAPWRTFLSFDAEAGRFIPAQDPKAALLDQLADYIRGEGCGQNQSQIIEWAKDALGIKKRDNALALLRRGEGNLWRSHEGFRKARIYEPI